MTKNEKNEKRKHYLVYQIEDNLNKKIYIGVHSTLKINDGYMGSGTGLKKAISEYGIENFSKTIIYDFDNEEDMLDKEAEIVNEEFIKRNDTYNIMLGGGFNANGLATVKDKEGNVFDVSVDDERYLSGELVGVAKGKIAIKDKNGNMFLVEKNNEKYLNGEYVSVNKNKTHMKDVDGNIFYVDVDDKRILDGELFGLSKGKKHTKETLKKLREIHKKNGHQQGEKNSQYGTRWIKNEKTKEVKKIKKEELDKYISLGWLPGMKLK